MPVYEYKCELCQLLTNITSSIDEYVAEIPCCNLECAGTMKRVFIDPPGIIFNGCGWGCKS